MDDYWLCSLLLLLAQLDRPEMLGVGGVTGSSKPSSTVFISREGCTEARAALLREDLQDRERDHSRRWRTAATLQRHGGLNKLADLREAELRAEFNRELCLLLGVEGRDGKDRLA